MYCSQCGKEIANNSKFCPECGKEIPTTESQDKPKNLSDFEQAKLSAERTKKSQTDDKNFTIFSIKGAGMLLVGVILFIFFLTYIYPLFSDSPPTNCQELSDSMVGEKVENLFGRKGDILKSELKEVISEKPNNLVCLSEVVTTAGDYELKLEFDGEFIKWGSKD
tara:strand:- start:92 stop:586 length:495 start_codon:yes stop_codon:yes gene_type:complete